MMPVMMFTFFLEAGTANGSGLTIIMGERHKESVNRALGARIIWRFLARCALAARPCHASSGSGACRANLAFPPNTPGGRKS